MPMRVSQLHTETPGALPQATRTAAVSTDTAQKVFQRQLTTLSQEQYDIHIRELVDAIIKQGERLSRRADMAEFSRYREMISGLIKETVDNSYLYHKKGAFDAHGRHRVYAVVRKIDAALDDMAQKLLEGQIEQLKLLDAIDDIRGLIVDLLL